MPPAGEGGTGALVCYGYDVSSPSTQASFEVSVEARSCPGRHTAQAFTLRPVGFRDSLQVEVTYNCTCGCSTGQEANSARCSGNGTYVCGLCECDPSYLGTRCECQEGENQSGYQNLCREAEGKPLCSGRGECSCNQCSCFESEFGRIYGPFCECDSFSCARNKGVLCSGRPLPPYICSEPDPGLDAVCSFQDGGRNGHASDWPGRRPGISPAYHWRMVDAHMWIITSSLRGSAVGSFWQDSPA